MRYSRDQEKAMLQVLEETAWGDIKGLLAIVDEALAIAMRATRDEVHLLGGARAGRGIRRRVQR